jgi:hypothetical protein
MSPSHSVPPHDSLSLSYVMCVCVCVCVYYIGGVCDVRLHGGLLHLFACHGPRYLPRYHTPHTHTNIFLLGMVLGNSLLLLVLNLGIKNIFIILVQKTSNTRGNPLGFIFWLVIILGIPLPPSLPRLSFLSSRPPSLPPALASPPLAPSLPFLCRCVCLFVSVFESVSVYALT